MFTQSVLVTYSSKTGNTRKLAEGIFRGLSGQVIKVRIVPVEENSQPQEEEIIFAGYWVDKGTADQMFLDYIGTLRDRKVGPFGTLGAYPDSDHARETAQKLEALVAERNSCLGTFLSQGKIDPILTEQFKKFPEGHPHFMDAESIKRPEEAAKHPNNADMEAGVKACAAMLTKACQTHREKQEEGDK